ncbi:MAG: hypothetical protein ACRDOI_24220 [Trebonia sp.]
MNLAATQIYALTEANGEATVGLRVDMAAMQTSVHADMFALKAALDLQGDSQRKEIGVTRATLLSTMSAFREAVDQRFETVDGQLRSLRGDMDGRFDAVDGRFDAVGQRFDALDTKLDAIIDELRGARN